MRVWRSVAFGLLIVPGLLTGTASAETISVSQTITITARIAPVRSIVVNEQGQMTKIYSNTNQAVVPRVYVNDVPGQERPLTPELLKQYQQIVDGRDDLNGIEIPVGLTIAKPENVQKILMTSVSNNTGRLIH